MALIFNINNYYYKNVFAHKFYYYICTKYFLLFSCSEYTNAHVQLNSRGSINEYTMKMASILRSNLCRR